MIIKETHLGITVYYNNVEEVKKFYGLEENKDIKTLEDVEEYLEKDYDGMEYPHFENVEDYEDYEEPKTNDEILKMIEENEEEIIDFIIDETKRNYEREIDIYYDADRNEVMTEEEVEFKGNAKKIYTIRPQTTADIYTDDIEFVSSMCIIYNLNIPKEYITVSEVKEYIETNYHEECENEFVNLIDEHYSDLYDFILAEIKENLK